MKINSFYITIVLLLAAMFYITGKYFRGFGRATVGITYAKEYKINSEKAATVKMIAVVPGQQVKKGDMLAELSSNSLQTDIDKLEFRITALKSEKSEKSKLIESEINYLQAQYTIDAQRLEAEIKQTESELSLNNSLARQFLADTASESKTNPTEIKIQSLKGEKENIRLAMKIKIEDITIKHRTEQSILASQILLNEGELSLLQNEKKNLVKVSTFDGVVETVYVKQGEDVASFSPLLSIFPVHPTTVVAYYSEMTKEMVAMGSEVIIRGYSSDAREVKGQVIGFGSIVALPEILQKSTAVKAFGREVFVEIPADNGFATGEKVLIRKP